MEQLRKKDRDSLLAEIQELRKTATKKPLNEQVNHVFASFSLYLHDSNGLLPIILLSLFHRNKMSSFLGAIETFAFRSPVPDSLSIPGRRFLFVRF